MTLLLLFANPVGASASPISSTAARGAARAGGSALLLQALRTTGPYVAATYTSVQGDGGNDGSAITTSATQPGDQLLVCVTDSQNATPPTMPAGWAEVRVSTTDSSTAFEAHYYILNNPASSTTYAWTVVGGRRTIVGILVRGGVYETGDTLGTGTATTHASTTVAAGPGRLLVACLVQRAFPTNTWVENQVGYWDEVGAAVGGDGVTNMQVSVQDRTGILGGSYSDTWTMPAAEPAIVGLFVFGSGQTDGATQVVTAGPAPKPSGTAVLLGSRADPPVGQQDTVPWFVASLGTARAMVGTTTVLGSRTDDGTLPVAPFPTIATPQARPAVAGQATTFGSRTDPFNDPAQSAPIVSVGRLPAQSGSATVATLRTDPPVSGQPTPATVPSIGRPPQPSGSALTFGSHTDPFNDPPQVGAIVSAGRPWPVSAGAVATARTVTDPPVITDFPPTPTPVISAGRAVAQPAGGTVTLAGLRADPFADPQPRALIVGGAVRPPVGAGVLSRPTVDPNTDSVPRALIVPAGIPTGRGTAVTVASTWDPEILAPPRLLVVPAGRPLWPGTAYTTAPVGPPPVAGPGTPPRQIVVPGFVPARVGSSNLAHVMHSCSIPPGRTGTTTRPASGTTVYNRALTTRPSTGTTTRPNTGTTVDPC